jgi:hypothetical protein
MKLNQCLSRRDNESPRIGVWSIIGVVALVAVAATLIANVPDIKRLIKIHMM